MLPLFYSGKVRYSRFLKILFSTTLEISYLQVHPNYARTKNTIQLLCMFGSPFWDYVIYGNCITIVLLIGSSFWYCMFCGMYAYPMKINLYLHFFFVRYCDTFFNTSQLRYLFVQCSHVFLMILELLYILVRSNYLRRFGYKIAIIQLH